MSWAEIAYSSCKTVLKLPLLQSILPEKSFETLKIRSSEHVFHIEFESLEEDHPGGNLMVYPIFSKDGSSKNQPAISISFYNESYELLVKTKHASCAWNMDQYLKKGESKTVFGCGSSEYLSEQDDDSKDDDYRDRANNQFVKLPLLQPLIMVVECFASSNTTKTSQLLDFEKLLEKPGAVTMMEKMYLSPETTYADWEFHLSREGVVVKAHKSVISLACSVFEAMLRLPMSESSSGRLVVNNISSQMFKLFLKRIYLGPCNNFQQSELDDVEEVQEFIDLLILSDFYRVNNLVEECLDQLSWHVQAGNVGRVLKAVSSIAQNTFTESVIEDCVIVINRHVRDEDQKVDKSAGIEVLLQTAYNLEEFASKADKVEKE